MSENGTKKRKKNIQVEKSHDDDGGIKKKRKVENGVEKVEKPNKEKRIERKNEADGERKMEKRKEGSKLKKKDIKKIGEEKKKATTKTSKKNKDDGEKDEKTMDYKKFHLFRMKDKWKKGKAKTKRNRDQKSAKKADVSEKAEKPKEKKRDAQKKEEKRLSKIVEDFGPCDISELVHYWNLFAASNLTAVEREENSLPLDNVLANTNGRKPASFFTKKIPKWTDWLKKEIPNGSPQVVVLCSSALRAANLNRDLAPFKTEKCRVAKLFRKEKAKEQGDYLTKHTVNMAIGTPHRIDLLLSHKTLKLGECRVIALDWSFVDVKKRRLITIPELQVDLLQLFRKYFIPLFKNKENVSLMLF